MGEGGYPERWGAVSIRKDTTENQARRRSGGVEKEEEKTIELKMAFRHEMAIVGLEIEEELIATITNPDETVAERKNQRITLAEKCNKRLLAKFSEAGNKGKARQWPRSIDLPQSLQDQYHAFSEGVLAYAEECMTVIEFEQALIKKICSGNPLDLGSYIYKNSLGNLPREEIKAFAQEGYLIVEIEDALDFRNFYTRKSANITGKERRRAERTLGYYTSTLEIDGKNIHCLVVRAASSDNLEKYSSSDESSYMPDLIRHERQHFINNVGFHGFADRVEPGTGMTDEYIARVEVPELVGQGNSSRGFYKKRDELHEKETQYALRKVKDELICRIREINTDAEFCTNFFNDSVYEWIKKLFQIRDRHKVQKLLQDIKILLADTFKVFKGERARSLLVFQLIDMPVTFIPEALRQISQFYKINPDKVPKD